MILLALVFLMPPAYAQYDIPPNIRRIMEKAQTGKEITPGEQKALEEWGKSMSKAGEKLLPKEKTGDATLGQAGVCPKKVSVKGLPSKAPSRNAYLALVKEAAQFYGNKAGKARPQIDSALRSAKKDGDGADMGSVFLMMGAGSASVYATTWSAARKPDDALAANNLGVALTGMGDYQRAVAVLLYADTLKPNAPLILADTGWAYYNMGDLAGAKPLFEKVARLSPEFAAAQLGLGLVAECQGNHAVAVTHLRKALAGQYSAVGVAALRAAQGAPQGKGGQPASIAPIATEKGEAKGIDLPDPPISNIRVRTAGAEEALAKIDGEVAGRIKALFKEKQALARIVAKQIARSMESPDRAVVLPRDFAKELFLFENVATSLLGENGRVAGGLKQTEARFEAGAKAAEKETPDLMKDMETHIQYLKELEACGDNDYYGLTAPILDRVYPPTLNELLNVERELHILLSYQNAIRMGSSLPGLANAYASLECIPPEPPQQPEAAKAPEIKKKQPPPCPFKKPLSVSLAIVSFSLDCEKVRIEGGEGLLVSLQRDFTKHETTMGIGVGAGVGGGVASGSAKIMVEVTTDGENVTDVGLSASVGTSLGLGGTIQSELGAQVSLQGGPDIGMETKGSLDLGGLQVDVPSD
ncbi:MAG: tetratricopeptide repeat protein [candidate division NC10 bacterium]|nr:tetratricopeptide repeat protein [candidate division NC10 bacterium]